MDFAYAIHSDVGALRGRPGQRRGRALRRPSCAAAMWSDRHRAQRPPQPSVAELCAHRARAQQDPSLPENLEIESSHDLGVKLLAQAMRAEGSAAAEPPPQGRGGPPRCGSNSRPQAGCANVEQLFIDLGSGRKIASIMAKKLARMLADQGQRPDAVSLTLGRFASGRVASPRPRHNADGSEGASVQLASCCRPIPGDEVRGYLGRGEGLIVHTAECQVTSALPPRQRALDPGGVGPRSDTQLRGQCGRVVDQRQGVLAQVAQAVRCRRGRHHPCDHARRGHAAARNRRDGPATGSAGPLHLAEVLRVLRRAPAVQRVLAPQAGLAVLGPARPGAG